MFLQAPSAHTNGTHGATSTLLATHATPSVTVVKIPASRLSSALTAAILILDTAASEAVTTHGPSAQIIVPQIYRTTELNASTRC